MAKEEKQNSVSHFLQGWQQRFGGKSVNEPPSKKPFPKDHFYTPEELSFLFKSNKLSTIDTWAVSTGSWAYQQSKAQHSDNPYSSVIWKDGLMATWIDGRLITDTPQNQIEKLILLQILNFDIPPKYQNAIDNYKGQRLVGNYFKVSDGKSIIKISSYNKGHLIDEKPSLTIQKWDFDTLSTKDVENISYDDFKKGIYIDYQMMEDAERNKFLERLSAKEEGIKQFHKILTAVKDSSSPSFGGTIPLEDRKVHKIDDSSGEVLPVSWSLEGNKGIKVSVYTKEDNLNTHIIHIDENTAYKYDSLLKTIEDIVESERVNELLRSLVAVLGNNFGGIKIFTKSNNATLMEAREGTVNAVVSTVDGRTFASNLNTYKEIALTKDELSKLVAVLLQEVQQKPTSINMAKDNPAFLDFFGNISNINTQIEGTRETTKPHRLSAKEKGEATLRIDKRIIELERLGKELSHNTDHGNSAEPLASKYSPEPSGAQSATSSVAKLQKGFVNSKDIAIKIAPFLLNFSKDEEIDANTFGKKLVQSIQKPTNQLSDYVRFVDVYGEKTVLRLSDHSGNARNIIISGKKSDKGISIVIKTPASTGHKRKFKGNSWARVTEYIYNNPDKARLLDIGKGIFDLVDRGEYTDLAGANEINISPRKNEPKKLMTPDGRLLGVTWKGKIYLSPEAKGFEAPVHEYTHLWAEALQDRNYKEWRNVVSMMKKSNLWNEVSDLHTELITTDDIAEEVLATYSGRRGAEKLNSKFLEIASSDKSMDEKTAMMQSVNQVNNAVAKFWKVMTDHLHIHYTTAEEVADRVLYDYTRGLYPLNYSEVVEKKGKTKPYYVTVEQKEGPDGRWHRPEVEERAAYDRYGKMLADKLSLQLTYEELPWLKSQKTQPCDLDKKQYQGLNSLMLALDAERHGYTLPVYISKEDISKKGLLIKSDARSFPLIAVLGVTEVYNIDQTNYPIQYAKEFEAMKMGSIAASRYDKRHNSLELLLGKNTWSSQINYDGKPSLASYSYKNDSIHIASPNSYENKDSFYRDLAQGLIRSTRKAEAKSTKFESLINEELISLVGSAMIGQKEHFDVTTPQQSSLWKERLREDPSYTKKVLLAANDASQIIYQRINRVKHSTNQDLDLRTTTPLEMDIDGNGIVDSQENYAADKRQGSNENQEEDEDVPQQEKHHHHKR